jgi:8-hydroxy-5-deazaflavin:NADPH oxidoreductase
VVPIAGDDAARRAVAPLVRDLGGEPLDAGGIDHAHYLEAMAAVIIRCWFAARTRSRRSSSP